MQNKTRNLSPELFYQKYTKINYRVVLLIAINALLTANVLFPQAAHAGFLDKVADKFSTAAKKLDPTDKKSAVRGVLRELDISNPNSETCKAVMTDGAEFVGKAASSSSNPYAMAAGTAISISRAMCSKPVNNGNVAASEDAAAEAIAASYTAAVKMKELEVQGKIEEARIIQASLVEMTKVQSAAEVEKIRIGLQAAIVKADADVKIEELRQQGRVKEAEILATALQRQTEAQQNGLTERVKIETETLLALTKANNEVRLREIDLNAALKRRELTNNLIGQGLDAILKHFLNKGELEKEREITKREIELKKIDLEIAKVNAGQTPNSQLPNEDPNLALIKDWGLTTTACNNSGLVFIAIDNKQYCAFPTDWLSAGQYVYNRSTDNLNPLTNINVSNPSPLPTNSPQQTEPSVSPDEGFQ
jgi:hypothetical protein